ncbi:hypothetical protein [Paenibacillus gansuensis]|uniref:Uncharacterized protein n=1 Tax=Paenibacillus gansuensis TaxID=306542 RepID=A0ABW5P9S4_9BACL
MTVHSVELEFNFTREQNTAVIETIAELSENAYYQGGRVAGLFADEMRVPDVYRYDLRYIANTESWEAVRLPQDASPAGGMGEDTRPTLLVLMESPHNDEYLYLDENGDPVKIPVVRDRADAVRRIARVEPVRPANGKTGEHMDRFLAAVAEGLAPSGRDVMYRVIVANPVQYQTSLHAVHGGTLSKPLYGALRDNVWKALWTQEAVRSDFAARLAAYKPAVIFNGCTRVVKPLVEEAIREVLRGQAVECYRVAHPFAWFSAANRKLTRVELEE